jgi:hypothetical protein
MSRSSMLTTLPAVFNISNLPSFTKAPAATNPFTESRSIFRTTTFLCVEGIDGRLRWGLLLILPPFPGIGCSELCCSNQSVIGLRYLNAPDLPRFADAVFFWTTHQRQSRFFSELSFLYQ